MSPHKTGARGGEESSSGSRGIRPVISILERVEYVGASHQHGEWAQRVLDLHGAGVMREHVRQPTICLRRLIEAAADEAHALAAQPRLHLAVTHAAWLAHPLAGCRILDETAARFGARHDPAGAVHGRV